MNDSIIETTTTKPRSFQLHVGPLGDFGLRPTEASFATQAPPPLPLSPLQDDIIDDVGDFVAAAEILKERGAYKIYIMATHGLLSADAPRLIEESAIDEVRAPSALAAGSCRRTTPTFAVETRLEGGSRPGLAHPIIAPESGSRERSLPPAGSSAEFI